MKEVLGIKMENNEKKNRKEIGRLWTVNLQKKGMAGMKKKKAHLHYLGIGNENKVLWRLAECIRMIARADFLALLWRAAALV